MNPDDNDRICRVSQPTIVVNATEILLLPDWVCRIYNLFMELALQESACVLGRVIDEAAASLFCFQVKRLF